MLTTVDRVLLGLWFLPLALGLAVGVRAGDDDGWVVLFVTGIVAALYVVVLARMFHYARRRGGAERIAAQAPVPGPGEDRAFLAGHGDVDAPRGRAFFLPPALCLLLVVAAVYVVVAEGSWTFVVIAAQLVTVTTMAAYVHERESELCPAA